MKCPTWATPNFRSPFSVFLLLLQVRSTAMRQAQPTTCLVCCYRFTASQPVARPSARAVFAVCSVSLFSFPFFRHCSHTGPCQPQGQLSAEATCVCLSVDSTDVLCHQGFLCVWTSVAKSESTEPSNQTTWILDSIFRSRVLRAGHWYLSQRRLPVTGRGNLPAN